MEVGKAGDDEPPGAVQKGQVGVLLRQDGEGPGAHPLLADQESIPDGAQVLGVPAVTEIAVEDKGHGFHEDSPQECPAEVMSLLC